MPVTGHIFSSAGGCSLRYFWTFSWPRPFAGDKAIAHLGEITHDALAYLVYSVVGLHIAAKQSRILAPPWIASLRSR